MVKVQFHSSFPFFFLFLFVCADIDECSGPFHVCTKPSAGGHCENTKGSYQCSCVRGFTGNGIQIGSKMENETGLSCSGKRQCCPKTVKKVLKVLGIYCFCFQYVAPNITVHVYKMERFFFAEKALENGKEMEKQFSSPSFWRHGRDHR